MDKMHKGSCMCEAVRYEVSPPFTGIINCHCKQCQQLHGSYNPLLITDKENFKFTAGGDNVTWYNSSSHSERGFCKTCGSAMFKRDKAGPKIKISVGNLDNTSSLTSIKNVETGSAGNYYSMPPGETG